MVMEATRMRAASSTARMVPKSTWMRSMLLPRRETMRTPKAREIKYKAAKLASSRRVVRRVTAPASRATASPATMPPTVMA